MHNHLPSAKSGWATFFLGIAALSCFAQQVKQDKTPEPSIKLDPQLFAVTDDEKRKIAALIDRLAEIKDPDYGIAPWMSGSQFAPIKESATFGAGILMNHGLKSNEALEQLVALGPKALPQLLERLSDSKPTKLVMEHEGGFGGQWYGREIQLNEANPVEQQIKTTHGDFFGRDLRFNGKDVRSHTVTVGDVCFVIIGQIVNRSYQAVRYQPTACRVINSPSHDPKIAEIVRTIWKSDQPAQKLIDSLLIDLGTKDSDNLECGSAMRLLYYFPNQSAELIAKRIADPDLRRPEDFIKSVRTSSNPVITDALFKVMEHTQSAESFHASMSEAVVKRDAELVFKRSRELLAVPPLANQGPFGPEYHILMSAANYFPDKSQELFATYRNHKTLETLRSTIHALAQTTNSRPWKIQYLSALLDDETDTGWQYGPDYDRKPIRICDEAAKTLADHYLPNVRFEYEKNPEHLTREIGKIKRVLAGEKNVSFEAPRRADMPKDLPKRAPIHVVKLPDFVRLHAISNQDTFWVSDGPWILKVDAATSKIAERIRLEQGRGGLLPNAPGDRVFEYFGDDGGHVLVSDVRTGRMLKKVTTPFHDGVQFRDPLQVRNLGDITVCGARSEWIMALTQDGALHSIHVDTGKYRVEWKHDHLMPISHTNIIGVQGTSKVLIDGIAEANSIDGPPQLWDQVARQIKIIQKVPRGGWRAAWGDFAWNHMNGNATVWNLAKSHNLALPDHAQGTAEVACSSNQSHLFALRGDGSIDVFRIENGTELKPISRLTSSITDELEYGSIVVSQDDRSVFFNGQTKKSNQETVIAVYDISNL